MVRQGRKVGTAKKDSGNSKKILRSATVTLMLVVGLFVFLGATTLTQSAASADSAPVASKPPDTAQIAKLNRQANHFRRLSDYWAHKLGFHVTNGHRVLKPSKSVAYETWRRDFWKAKAARLQHLYTSTHCNLIRGITVKGSHASLHQRRMITIVLNLGTRKHANTKVLRSAIAAMTQESSATNIASGDGNSVGLFQLIASWGSVSWRLVPENSAGWYFSRAISINHSKPYLTIGQLSQAVEGSGFPLAYNQWVPESGRTLAAYRHCLAR